MDLKNYLKKMGMLLIVILGITQVNAQLVVENDSIFKTADQMLLANELFESGEPFAEALGYDLDLLDPMVPNAPDSVSYTTGIEAYEYSRYLLNTLGGRSGMGLHMMWSPIVTMNAAMQPESFDGMFTGGTANGFKEDDMLMMMVGNFSMNANQTPPDNPFPQFADFMSGNNNLPQAVASDFQMNWASTRWDRSKMDKVLNLGAMGQSLLKQYFWAADMLGAYHDGDDNGIEPDGTNSPDSLDSPNFDPNNNIYYGGNNLDGYIGQVLTAISINKTNFLINNLAYDGTGLGAVDPATYDPVDGIQYFPTQISLTENMVLESLPPQASDLTVVDDKSLLFDQLSYLWGTSSFVNMMNPNDESDAAHYAYHEVFDGYPFPADMATTGTPGPFDLMKGTSKVIFMNLMAMHFNETEGTFVNESSLNTSNQPDMGNEISAVNAGYIIASLSIFSEEFAGTPLQTMADNAIIAQADFILNNFIDTEGGYYNAFTIGSGASTSAKTVEANLAIIRGLYAAYNHTGDANYLNAANTAYNYMINNYYAPGQHAFATTLGESNAVYTPKTLGLFAGALREAKLTGNQSDAELIFTRVSKKVYNGMLLAEHEASGETGSDSDGDNIPYVVGGTKPFVFAESASMSIDLTTGIFDTFGKDEVEMTIYPNPASDYVNVQLNSSDKIDEINIFNVSGQNVLHISGGKQSSISNVSLMDLATGTYFMRIRTENQKLAIRKLIKN